MAAFVTQFQFVILCIFSGLLGLTILAAFVLALKWGGAWTRLREAWRTVTERGPYQGRISSVLVWLCVVPLVCVLVVRGSTKNGGGTNAPPTCMMRQMPTMSVASEDITRGYRVSSEGEESIRPIPPGAVTNDLLRRRGGYDWAFRVAPEGWRFPYRDGCLTGVTVLARGEVRPDVGTLYFPVPVTNGVSLLPEARWNLLTNGGASVFSHAVTADGSLLLDWHNALVGRDVNCPTNLQMELRADGGFAWRTDDGAQFYLPVLPFDWDGDGLENSVDPDPLVAHPFDCHGANAEWYSVVCSNVFTHVVASGVQSIFLPNGEETSFKTNANDRVYYFVEVVAEQGPAPIYFMADRDSWLGSPAVVARTGETNRVPLLIGIAYAVTSTVPISVSAPDAEYAEITTNDVDNYIVEWPLEIELVENLGGGGGRSYSVEVRPFDPGGEFVWGVEVSSGAVLASVPRSGACVCWSGWGNFVSSSCSGCRCGGCSASGCFLFGGSRFDFSGGSCGCSEDHSEEDDSSGGGGEPNTNFGPGVSVEADKSAIVFEDEYSNDHDDTVPRRSTWTCVTVEFAAGIEDASCSVELMGGASSVVMHENSRSGPACTSRRYNLKKNRTVTKKFYLEGVGPSSGLNDVEVRASIAGGGFGRDSADLTVYKVELMPQDFLSEDLMCRHELGIGEEVMIGVTPDSSWTVVSTQGEIKESNVHVAPYVGGNYELMFNMQETSFITPLSVHLPQKMVVQNIPIVTHMDIGSNVAGCVGMLLPLGIMPTNVSFQAIEVQEVASSNSYYTGYFSSETWVPHRYHVSSEGAGRWRVPGPGFEDTAEIDACFQPWSLGILRWNIPVAWRKKQDEDSAVTTFDNVVQSFEITAEGVVVVRKFDYSVRRVRNHIVELYRNP